MPKITDLAISTIPSGRQEPGGPFAGGYWMSVMKPPKPKPGKPKPPSKPKPKPSKKKAGELPAEAVVQMRQQLQQRVKTHSY